MTNIFLSYLEISIPISFMIAVLLLLTPFLNKRYAAKWKYWIWIVLALRLIMPFGGNGGQPVAEIPPQRETVTPSISEKAPPEALAAETPRGRVIVEIPAQMTNPIVMQPEKAGSNISMLDIVALVWMLGSLFLISVHLVSYLHYKRQILKKGKPVKDNDILCLLLKLKRELHINRTLSVIEYPEAASPMLIGFFKPILVLPKEQYSSEEMFFILKHELVHLKRGDIYLKLLFVAANAVHWFNPLTWLMRKEAAVDMELSCDERVTQGADYATRKAYTETLLSTLHKHSAKKTVLSTGFYGGKSIMKKRFQNVLAKKRKKNGVAVLICAIILAVGLGTLVGCSITKGNTEDGSDSNASGTDGTGSQMTESTNNEQSNGTASTQDEDTPDGMEEWYKAILLGKEDFIRIDYRGEDKSLNIKNIKQVVSDEDWVTAEVTKFAIIDLDGNGEDELVLWIHANEDLDYGFEILFYQDQEVYGFTLPARGFMNPKTDGTFDTAGGIEDSDDYYGVGRLIISEKSYKIVDASDSGSQLSKPDLGWYDLTPENVELAFENGF